MKKIVFTLQVFGTIALFPIYVVLEMNHGTGKLPENKNHPVVKEKIEKPSSTHLWMLKLKMKCLYL